MSEAILPDDRTAPEFDSASKCPKCLHGIVSTVYHSGRENFSAFGWPCYDWHQHHRGYHPREHFARTCQRCHYQWTEACLS